MANFKQPQRVSDLAAYPGGSPIPLLIGSTTRVNASVGNTSTTAAPVPAGGNVLLVRATGPVWLRFGDSGVGAASAATTSILFVAGEAPYVLNPGETHFRALRAGSEDVLLQLESVSTL